MTTRAFMILAVLAALSVALSGCGGSRSIGPSNSAPPLDRGSVRVTVQWPQPGNRAIPDDAVRINITIVGTGVGEFTESIDRPQTALTLDNVPVGSRTIKASAFAQGNETPGALGEATVTVVKDETANAEIVLQLLTASEQSVYAGLAKIRDIVFVSTAEPTSAEVQAVFDDSDAAVTADGNNSRAQAGYAVAKLWLESVKLIEKYPSIFPPEEELFSRSPDLLLQTAEPIRMLSFFKLADSVKDQGNPVRAVIPQYADVYKLPAQSRTVVPVADVIAFQADLKDIMLPAIDDALAHLALAEADPAFMMRHGYNWDPSVPYVIIDRGDLLIFDGLVRATKALMLLGVSYNADSGTFNWDLQGSALDANSDGTLTPSEYMPADPWGTLTEPALMGQIKTVLDEACIKVQAGLGETLAEEGDFYDFLNWHTPGGNVTETELVSFKAAVFQLQQALTTPQAIPIPLENGDVVIVRIDISAWSNDPPADLKDMFPNKSAVSDDVIPGTWPDPSFGGIFPDDLPDSVLNSMN